MKPEEERYQRQIFQTQRTWLEKEYTAAKAEKPKNAAKIIELENRVKSFRREIDAFNLKTKGKK